MLFEQLKYRWWQPKEVVIPLLPSAIASTGLDYDINSYLQLDAGWSWLRDRNQFYIRSACGSEDQLFDCHLERTYSGFCALDDRVFHSVIDKVAIYASFVVAAEDKTAIPRVRVRLASRVYPKCGRSGQALRNEIAKEDRAQAKPEVAGSVILALCYDRNAHWYGDIGRELKDRLSSNRKRGQRLHDFPPARICSEICERYVDERRASRSDVKKTTTPGGTLGYGTVMIVAANFGAHDQRVVHDGGGYETELLT